MVFLIALLACRPPETPKPTEQTMNQYRMGQSDFFEQQIFPRHANLRWDTGLAQATQELIAKIRSTDAHLSVSMMQAATTRVGFPGQANYIKALTGGEFPFEAIQHLRFRQNPIDFGFSKRMFADGRVLWVIGWADHLVDMDPVPLSIPLDGIFPIHIDEYDADKALLYIASPDQPVETIELLPSAHRWLNGFHYPGEYTFEVVLQKKQGVEFHNEIALLFSVFVDETLPEVPSAIQYTQAANPIAAEEELLIAVNRLRTQRGLHALRPFELFKPLAREHSALMASHGTVAHRIPNVTDGVPVRASQIAHPKAKHYQNVAAAMTAQEALDLAIQSPGHLQVFLCQTCTHISIGAALEPRVYGVPRLFVTWEVLEFSQGEPKAIEMLNRDLQNRR